MIWRRSENSYEAVDYRCRAIRTAIIDDKDVETLLKSEYRPRDLFDVFLFLVGGDDDNTV